MDDFKGEEKNSLHYGETDDSTSPGVEHSFRKEEALGGGSLSDRKVMEEETRIDATLAQVDGKASLDTVRSALHTLRPTKESPIGTRNVDVTSTPKADMGIANKKAGPFKQLITTTQEGVSNFVYEYLGDRAPGFIKEHVPVYRTVDKRYAGAGNQSGTSEWTIGQGAKKHATTWVENHKPNPHDPLTTHLGDPDAPEVAAIKSTLGELIKHGDATVTHYGERGSSRKKVVLRHVEWEKPVRHTIIKSNKH